MKKGIACKEKFVEIFGFDPTLKDNQISLGEVGARLTYTEENCPDKLKPLPGEDFDFFNSSQKTHNDKNPLSPLKHDKKE